MAIQWGATTDYGTGNNSEPGRQGYGNFRQQARNQGYQGTFVAPQNYADAAGQSFGRASSILQGGFSGQNQGNVDYQDALRNAAMSKLQGLQNQSADQKSILKNDLEQSFQNQANMLRRSAAGTGAGSSLGYGRSAGDLANQFQQNMAKGMVGVDESALNQLQGLGGIGQQLNAQDLANRQFDYNQSQDLANMYMDWAGVESGRDAQASANAAQATAARKAAQNALISNILQAGGTAAGIALGKK